MRVRKMSFFSQGEKLLLLIRWEDLSHDDCLATLIDYMVDSQSIRHLFNEERRTAIVNSIRTDVLQAGLTYTRDIAWKFFLS